MKKAYSLVAVVGLAFAVAFSASVAGAATTFTRDLTIGSTGADVVSLQDLLIAKGFLVMPAGVAEGYFGSLTKSALSKWQASVGISPASGYFGPITRGYVANMSMSSGSDNGSSSSSSSGDTLQGGEGDIKDFKVLGSPANSTVREGEDKKVLGFEFTAKDSDLRVERVEVTASSTSGSTNKRDPWKYVTAATLYHGTKKVATVDNLDDEDSWDEGDDNVYSFRFDNVDSIVKEDDKDQFYVAFEAKDTLDSGRVSAPFAVYIDTDGIRAVDAEGIDIYEGKPSSTKTVTFDKADAGDVEVNLDEDDNKDRTVFIDKDNETDDVEVMRFTIESKTSDNTLKELQVQLATSTATTTHIADVVKSLKLEIDGEEVGSESVDDTDAGTTTATFQDLDVDIAENDTVEVVVTADIAERDGNYGDGYKFFGYVPASGYDMEDAQGDAVDVTDSVYGGDIELRENGIQIDYTSSSATRTNGSVAGDADSVEFKINFKVTANGDDVYLDGDTVATADPDTSTDGIAWSTTSDSTTGTSTLAAILTASDGYKSSDVNDSGDKEFKISKGNSRNFTLTVSVPAGADNTAAGVQINGFKWDTDSGDSMSNLYDIDLSDFRTDVVTGLYVR